MLILASDMKSGLRYEISMITAQFHSKPDPPFSTVQTMIGVMTSPDIIERDFLF